MGGVYKGLGHNQHELMTHAYWEFLIHEEEFQAPVPSMIEFLHGLPSLARPGLDPLTLSA